MISEEKCRDYFFAEYRVITPAKVLVLPPLGADFLCDLHKSEGVTHSAIISACNPGDSICDAATNAEHHAKLLIKAKEQWRCMPAEFAKTKGSSDVTPAVFILGIERDEALAIGRMFQQTVILFGDHDGSTRLLACRAEDQDSLIHPMHRAMEKLHAKLRAEGREVKFQKPRDDGEMTVTFPANRTADDEHQSVDKADEDDVPKKKTVEVKSRLIASADVDRIDQELLKWSGLEEQWDDNKLSDTYTVVSDVLSACRFVDVHEKEWDAGAPGQSGIWFKVFCDNPAGLKAEMRAQIDELIRRTSG